MNANKKSLRKGWMNEGNINLDELQCMKQLRVCEGNGCDLGSFGKA